MIDDERRSTCGFPAVERPACQPNGSVNLGEDIPLVDFYKWLILAHRIL